MMQLAGIKTVSKALGCFEVGYGHEGVVNELVLDVCPAKRCRQAIVTVEVELQAEWAPSRYTQVASQPSAVSRQQSAQKCALADA
jgi:hypothetical protein